MESYWMLKVYNSDITVCLIVSGLLILIILDYLRDAEIRALQGPNHRLQRCLIFSPLTFSVTLKVVYSTSELIALGCREKNLSPIRHLPDSICWRIRITFLLYCTSQKGEIQSWSGGSHSYATHEMETTKESANRESLVQSIMAIWALLLMLDNTLWGVTFREEMGEGIKAIFWDS